MLFLDEEREKKAHWMQGESERDKVLIFDQAILPLFKLQKSTIQDYYFVFGAEGVDFDNGGYGCKPVVYTYDQHERANSLEITLPPQSRFTKLIPHFSTGTRWDFQTDKNSQITFENQTFPYLYYSTFRKNYQNNNYGRTVKGRDIPLFLENKLTYMNLNQKEKADFLEYRLPEFKADLVYSVSFKFNEQFEPYARFGWKHKPEKIFRMFMEAHEHPQGHYTSFDPRYPDAGNERFLERFERGSSFDVLEW